MKMEIIDYIKFSNQEINTAESYLNYNLGPSREISLNEFLKKRCSEVYCLNRKDVNVMCSWVVTIPKTLTNSDPNDQSRFFKETYNFLEKRYGKDNVISSFVHLK